MISWIFEGNHGSLSEDTRNQHPGLQLDSVCVLEGPRKISQQRTGFSVAKKGWGAYIGLPLGKAWLVLRSLEKLL